MQDRFVKCQYYNLDFKTFSWIFSSEDENIEMQCNAQFATLWKKVNDFPPVPSRDVTNQTLVGREYSIYSRPGRVW